jgi:hypothetical protein
MANADAQAGMLGVARAIASRDRGEADLPMRRTVAAGMLAAVGVAVLATIPGRVDRSSEIRGDFPRTADSSGSLRAASGRGVREDAVSSLRRSDMRFELSIATAAALASSAQCADLHVPADFPTIQSAIASSADGDRIRVAPGSYEPFSFGDRKIVIESTEGPVETVIDASGFNGSAINFGTGCDFTSVLRGFTIKTGSGSQVGGWGRGGGVFIGGTPGSNTGAAATIEDCWFIGSSGGCGYGAGVYAQLANIAVRRCRFLSLAAQHHGPAISATPTEYPKVPGMDNDSILIEDCEFDNCDSYNNGGILIGVEYSPADVRLLRCVFRNNSAAYSTGSLLIGSSGQTGVTFRVAQCAFIANSGGWSNAISEGIPGSSGTPITLDIQDSAFADSGTSVRVRNGSSLRLGRNTFCYGSTAIQSSYTDLGGNRFTCDPAADCDSDGIADVVATTTGLVPDLNRDSVPDLCQCPGDLTRDGQVTGADIGAVLAFWGPNPAYAPADINGDGRVDGSDLGLLLASWGPCGQ